MSYSLYHYLETAIKECLGSKFFIDFTEDYSQVISFAYLIFNTKEQKEDFDNSIGGLIELVTNTEIKSYIKANLSLYENVNTKCFQEVADEHLKEVTDYITKIYDTKPLSIVDRGGLQTPDSIMNLAYSILDINKEDQVANFCSSTGAFLAMCEDKLSSGKQLVGYELDKERYVISLMIKDINKKSFDLKLCNVLETNISSYTKIFADLPFKMDLKLESDNLKDLARKFGENDAQSVLGEKLFIQKIIDSLTEEGKALVTVPTFFITSDNCNAFRNYLLTKGYLNCVIQCGFGMIPRTGLSISLLVLSKHNKEVRFIDASNECIKERLTSVFTDKNIKHITNAYKVENNLQENEDYTKHDLCPYKIVSYPNDLLETEIGIKEKHYDLVPYSYVSNVSLNQAGCSPLDELCTVKRGVSFSSEDLIQYTSTDAKEGNTEDNKETFLYLSQKDMQDGGILYGDLEVLTLPKDEKNYKKTKDGKLVCKQLTLQDNDIVLCCLKTNPLKIAMVHCSDDGIKIIPSCNLYVIRVRDEYKEKISPYLIKACLDKESTFKFLEANTNTFKILQKTVQQIQIRTDLSDDKVEEIVNNYKSTQEHIADLQKELARCRGELKDIVESI